MKLHFQMSFNSHTLGFNSNYSADFHMHYSYLFDFDQMVAVAINSRMAIADYFRKVEESRKIIAKILVMTSVEQYQVI